MEKRFLPINQGFDYYFGTSGCTSDDPPFAFIENKKILGLPLNPVKDLHVVGDFNRTNTDQESKRRLEQTENWLKATFPKEELEHWNWGDTPLNRESMHKVVFPDSQLVLDEKR